MNSKSETNKAYDALIITYCSMDDEEFQNNMIELTNKINPALTVCPHCGVDDFQHVDGCDYFLNLVTEFREHVV